MGQVKAENLYFVKSCNNLALHLGMCSKILGISEFVVVQLLHF